MNLIVSNSEDKTIKIWDSNTLQLLENIKRECDRYLINLKINK